MALAIRPFSEICGHFPIFVATFDIYLGFHTINLSYHRKLIIRVWVVHKCHYSVLVDYPQHWHQWSMVSAVPGATQGNSLIWACDHSSMRCPDSRHLPTRSDSTLRSDNILTMDTWALTHYASPLTPYLPPLLPIPALPSPATDTSELIWCVSLWSVITWRCVIDLQATFFPDMCTRACVY